MKSVVELGWELAWVGASLQAFTGMRRNEQLNELLGKVPEVASISEFERLEKTKNREKKNAWKWHSAETNLVCLHWVGSSHPCPWSTNSQWWAVVYTWLCLRIFPSLQLCKYDWVLSRGRGQWLLGWVPPSRRAFWTLLIEVLSKMNWPGSVIQLQAQHGLVHSTNVLWKHIASSCSMAGPLLVMELRKLGKGKRVGLEEERGKGEENWDDQNFFWFAVINSPFILAVVFIVRIKFF